MTKLPPRSPSQESVKIYGGRVNGVSTALPRGTTRATDVGDLLLRRSRRATRGARHDEVEDRASPLEAAPPRRDCHQRKRTRPRAQGRDRRTPGVDGERA